MFRKLITVAAAVMMAALCATPAGATATATPSGATATPAAKAAATAIATGATASGATASVATTASATIQQEANGKTVAGVSKATEISSARGKAETAVRSGENGNREAAEKKVIKVLAIGNSFSVDALNQHLYAIGAADGVEFVIGNMYIGGCSLERHFNNTGIANGGAGSRDYTYYKITSSAAGSKPSAEKGATSSAAGEKASAVEGTSSEARTSSAAGEKASAGEGTSSEAMTTSAAGDNPAASGKMTASGKMAASGKVTASGKMAASGKVTSMKGVTLEEALGDEEWDFVSFQQSSPLSGIYDSYEPYLKGLIDFVRARVPATTRLLFHQTWAYAGDATHSGFATYGKSTWKMYEAIMDASATACGKYGLQVIPSGTAIQNFRGTPYRDNVTRDGYHLNFTVGRYIASCTWYEVLTGRSVIGNGYAPDGLWEEHRIAAQKAAHAAVARPFKTTGLGIDNKPTLEDEAKVPEYTLPDPLTCLDGSKVKNSRQWMKKRRPEILNLFETEVYGKVPGRPAEMHFKELYSDATALGGKATRKEVEVYFDAKEKYKMSLLLYIPNGAKGPVPAFMGINFHGNKSVWNDPGILSPTDSARFGIWGSKGAPISERSSWWDLDQIIGAGYALVTFCRSDIDPDYYDAFANGIHPFFRKDTVPSPDQGGTIAAWAWGLSRALDYVETDPAIDAKKVAVIGHSRLGKTALWAAAEDQRFAISISNSSGCGGAALSRRAFGETVEVINRSFPHWFCENFRKYNGHEELLPVDQHELIALIAPRPVYVASATEDLWADPKGEFLSAENASPVYKLFGYKGLQGAEMLTESDTKVWGDVVAYHYREGAHDVTTWDWKNYIEFADRFFKK